MEVFAIKRILKRILAFILIFTICSCTLLKKEENEAHAFAIVDDAALLGVILAGVALSAGTYGIASSDSVQDLFCDIFSEDTLDNVREYLSAVSIGESKLSFDKLSSSSLALANVVRHVKAEYKFPVEYTSSGTYKTYDISGNVVEYASTDELINFIDSTGRGFYYVESLSSCEFMVNTSGDVVLKQDVFNQIKACVSSVMKKFVGIGKSVVSWFLDAASVEAVDYIVSISSAYYDKFGADYAATMSSIHGDSTTFLVEYNGKTASFSFFGVLLELHTDSGVYFCNFPVERFEQLNESYSSTGDISVFTSNMSQSYFLYNSFMGYNNLGGGAVSDYALRLDISYDTSANVAYIGVGDGNYGYTNLVSSSSVHLVNNGNTANYVIGTVGADGSITYQVVGEASTYPYVDGIAKGDNEVKVSGDVVLTDKILAQVMDTNLTVEEVNAQVAEVSDSVIAVDNSIKNGFQSNNSWLSKIWELIKSLPGLIVSAFGSLFDILFGFLDEILEAILGVPIDIVSGLTDVKDAVLDIPGDIVSSLTDVKAAVLDIPGDIVGVLVDVWESLKSIPGDIIDLLRELLVELFVPQDSYFNGWKNKFDNQLRNKLPYTTYIDFLEDIKEINSAKLDDITVTIYGQECTVLSFNWYYKCKDDIDNLIRGFTFIVLIFFNINQMYKLIRGTSLFKFEKYISK